MKNLRKTLFLLLCLSVLSCNPEKHNPENKASHIISNDISNQQISSFAEDAFGHIWIGTFRGLNKYNAYEYHQYFNSDDSLSISDNQVKDILCDTKGRTWIATVNGTSQYTEQDCFRRIPIESKTQYAMQIMENKEGRIFLNMAYEICEYFPEEERFKVVIPDLYHNNTFVSTIFIDASNHLWTINSELIRCFDLETMELKQSFNRADQPVQYAYLRDNGELWIASYNQLTLLDTRTGRYIAIPEAIASHPQLSEAVINFIHPYNHTSLLINTPQGIYLYNYMEKRVISQDENGFPFEPPAFNITSMFTDSQKNLWIGSSDQGFVTSYSYKERFNENNYLRKFMEHKSIVSLKKGKDDNLWITSAMDGLFVYHTKNGTIRPVETQQFFPEKKYFPNQVRSVFVDDDNHIWLITNYKLICCSYDEEHHLLREKKTYLLPGLTHDMSQDRNGTIWAGCSNENIYALRKGATAFEKVMLYPRSFTFTSAVITLSTGEIMVASFPHNPRIIDPNSWDVEEIDVTPQIKRSQFIPICLYEDSQGDIWIGTIANGLLRYSRETEELERMENTTSTDISSIQEDKQGNIWVSTLYGLSKYDRTTNSLSSYYMTDGIGGNQFNERSSCQMEDGTIIFGGTHGMTFFNPIDVTPKRNIALLFEDLKIHNQLISPLQGDIIHKSLRNNPDIELKHDHNSFSISFAALDYSEYERVHYHYMMEGFDKLWINARNNREAFYSNLPAGNYTFKVRISNNDRSIVETMNSISVRIKPAPWATWWSFTLYFLFALMIGLVIVRLYNRIQQNKRQIRKAEEEKEQEQRLNKMNMRYFANISHEFRTPLTMISGPVAQLCNDSSIADEPRQLLHIVQRSIHRMLTLVNQLLDFNRLENDALKLKVKRVEIISALKRLVELFILNANYKGITFKTFGLDDSFLTWLDSSKFEKITGNLISNALKFTASGGQIELTFDVITRGEAMNLFSLGEKDVSAEYIKVTVSDSGHGIPEDKLEMIFERYFQMNEPTQGIYNWGTGIGLYYARRLTELHHGYIKAMNRPEGNGALFVYILPVGDNAYTVEEKEMNNETQREVFPIEIEEQATLTKEKISANILPSILVVDDDTEIIHYLKSLLQKAYNVTCRFDAESAYRSLQEEEIDLVLSDIVMPATSGIELCRMIKEDMQLCHIPVVLITAKTTVEDQVAGLNSGADAYVTKPFDPNYLLALLKSQLTNREKVRNLLGKTTKTEKIAENILSPQDNAFVTGLYQLMEMELSNPELNITRMTEILHISRTKFYNKVKGLTGENPNVFFKTYKLNRAAELLAEGKYNISEVADMTGFATLSHFSASFKKQFGKSPSKYHA
jgi:signal transduction histidine kinase/DNA-binding response OmpR family regulator/ligand-binding sensor domain-containing protein